MSDQMPPAPADNAPARPAGMVNNSPPPGRQPRRRGPYSVVGRVGSGVSGVVIGRPDAAATLPGSRPGVAVADEFGLSDTYSLAATLGGSQPTLTMGQQIDSLFYIPDRLTGDSAIPFWDLTERTLSNEPDRRRPIPIARNELKFPPSSGIQDTVRLPPHLCVFHSNYFTHASLAAISSHWAALDDMRLFRSALLFLSRTELARAIEGLQVVGCIPKGPFKTILKPLSYALPSAWIVVHLTRMPKARDSNSFRISAPLPTNFPDHIGLTMFLRISGYPEVAKLLYTKGLTTIRRW